MNELTDKRFVMKLRGGEQVWITELEYAAVRQVINTGSFFEIGNKLINPHAILYVLPAEEIERTEKVKRGEWKCERGHWHPRGQECGHGELERYPKL